MNVVKRIFLLTLGLVVVLMVLSSEDLFYGLRRSFITNRLEKTNIVKLGNSTYYVPTIYRGDCKVLSIDSLKEYSERNQFSNGIPKLLHFVSSEEDISKAYGGVYKHCMKLNSDMKALLWTDASFYKLLVSRFSENMIRAWQEVFSNLDHPVRTALIRTMVLHVFGGVSLSMDTVCQHPIRQVQVNGSCFVSAGNTLKANIEHDRDDDFGESVFGCSPDHPFLVQLMDNSEKIALNRAYFTEHILVYNKGHKDHGVSQLNLNTAEQILPKSEMDKLCNQTHTSLQMKRACNSLKSYKTEGPSKAMMVHQPIYGVSRHQIVAEDICTVGTPVYLVII